MKNINPEKLFLKTIWFGLISIFTAILGTMMWLAAIALSISRNNNVLDHRGLTISIIFSAAILVLLLSFLIFILRKSGKALLRWTRKSVIILIPCVIAVLVITLFSLNQIDFGNQKDESISAQKEVYTEPAPTPSELLALTNEQRVKSKLNPLSISLKLNESALLKCNDMVAKNYWSHEDSSGTKPWSFIDRVGYKYTKAGENLAYGFNSAQETVNGWMDSEGHRANILHANYTEVGFGICRSENYIDKGQQTIVVQHFAQPAN